VTEPLRHHRFAAIPIVTRAAGTTIPTIYGDFTALAYRTVGGEEHVAFVMGDVVARADVLVRLHSECLTGDLFGSLRCDCGSQLHRALEAIGELGCGVVVYLRGHEGRGIGIAHKLQAYQLQDGGRDTVEANLDLGLPADAREYDVAAAILADLGVRSLRLLTNNPAKTDALIAHGFTVIERVAIDSTPNAHNLRYLRTKRDKFGHVLDLPDTLPSEA
jgi:3,4-dihydroxy 2-butanone 4-phosphate synthase / GTP cyclohydrolase II